MSKIADDENDATIVTDFVYDRNKTEQKPWKLCFDVTGPGWEVVFLSQLIIVLILLSFCIYKISLKQLSCEETSVWFSILSGLVGYVLPNPRILIKLLIRQQDNLWQL